MQLLVADFETFYCSKTYTLSKLTTEAYIRDQRFEPLGCGVYDADGNKDYYEKPDLKTLLGHLDWTNTALICHHAHFDGFILAHHFGIIPKFYIDTISMARFVHGPHQRCSLSALAKLYGLPEKTVPYNLFDGKRYHQLDSYTRKTLGEGCLHDCELTMQIFEKMLPHVPEEELYIQDLSIRMFTNPRLEGDKELLMKICHEEADRKAEMMHELQVSAKELQSAAKFTELLQAEGVEIEYKEGKPSKKTGETKLIPCFAKTDFFMQELLQHDNERVQALAEARLGVKSTIAETRAGRLLDMAERGPMCVYLHQPGTHTLRTAGGDKCNFGNLPKKGDIRKSLKAQKGKKIAVFDLKQIELRTELWLAGDQDKLDLLASGGNIYLDMGKKIYGRDIDKFKDEDEYKTSKETVLGCGYGMGHVKFYHFLVGKGIDTTEKFTEYAIQVYRSDNGPILGLWKEGTKVFKAIARGEEFEWKIFTIKDKKLYAPTGAFIHFNSIFFDEEDRTWKMEVRKGKIEKMFGGHFIENVNQFLARCVFYHGIRLCAEAGFYPVMTTYDEGVFLLEEELAAHHATIIKRCMETTPDWIPGLPLEVEYGISERYEK